MTSFIIRFCFIALLLGTACQWLDQESAPPTEPAKQESKAVVKYGVPVVSGPMDSVLLKDYVPDSSLTNLLVAHTAISLN